MKRIVATIGVLLVSTVASAQTTVTRGPILVTDRIAWSNPDNVSLTDAPTFEYRLRDGSYIPVTALTNVNCVAGTPVVCTASLTQSNVDALNMVGAHSLTLTLFRQDVGESPVSAPFTLQSPAAAPTNLRIIR